MADYFYLSRETDQPYQAFMASVDYQQFLMNLHRRCDRHRIRIYGWSLLATRIDVLFSAHSQVSAV